MTVGALATRDELMRLAVASGYPVLDLSLGVAADPPPTVKHRPAAAAAAYPLSAGAPGLRTAASEYLARRFRVHVAADALAACVGSKEFICTLPLFIRRLLGASEIRPIRDIVLIPALGYPSYRFGAELAGLRTYPVPMTPEFTMALHLLPAEVVTRALMLWVNSPANPTGVSEDLGSIAAWGRQNGVIVASDEAYAEATWSHAPRTVLQHGLDGLLCVHSLSKRSNAPGLRIGFYAGDHGLVSGLVSLRREAGLIAAAAAQDDATHLLRDDEHATAQRSRNYTRVNGLIAALRANDITCVCPDGGLFVWVDAPGGDGAMFARVAAAEAGIVLRAGHEFGEAGVRYARIAAVRDVADIATRLAMLPRQTTSRADLRRLSR